MHNPTIHLEGLDLAGKSTISALLASRLNAVHRKNSLVEGNLLHHKAEIMRKNGTIDDEALSWVYYACLLIDIEKYRMPEKPCVQDSTIILRSLAFNKAKGNHELAAAFEEKLSVHPRFSLTVVLYAGDETRLKRLEGRISRGNDNPEDYIIRNNPALFHAMDACLAEYAKRYFNAVIIDTSKLEQDGEKERVVTEILRSLK